MPPKSCWSFSKTVDSFKTYFTDSNTPSVLKQISAQEQDLAVGCYGMSVAFLEDALIATQTISRGQVYLYEPESKLVTSCVESMVLDA